MNPSGEMEGGGDSSVKSRGNKGFTLIEIIIVIVLAGIILPALVALFLAGVKQSGKPEMVTTAIYLAQQKMEELMKFDYMDASLDSIALTPYANTDLANYQWQWEIVFVNSDFNVSGIDQGYKRIMARVKDLDGDTYEIYSVVTDFP